MTTGSLGTQPIGPLMLRMVTPTIAAQLVNLLYTIVDRIFIGHIPGIGAAALTGVGVTTPIITVLAAFSMFFGNGGAPLAAIALGRGDEEKARRILGNCVTLLVASAAVLTVVLLVLRRPILLAIGASAETYPYAAAYLTAYLPGTVMVLLTLGLAPFVIAQGGSRLSMLVTVSGALMNIGLDALFVYGLGWGVRGAAVATVLSQTLCGVLFLFYLTRKARVLYIRRSYLRVQWPVVKKIASLGVSPFVMGATESVIGFVMNSGLQQWGGDAYVGCLTVMQSVMQFMSAPVGGFTQGVTPVISYNYGAGNTARVRACVKRTAVCMVGYTACFAVSTMLFPGLYARIFTGDAEILALTRRALPVFMAGMLVFGVQRTCQTAFLALGQARVSLFIALLRKVFLLVPLALVLPHFFGAFGIYCAEPIADATAATICGIIFLIRFPKILAAKPQA